MHLIKSETIAIGIGYWRWGGDYGGCWEVYLGPWVLCLAKEEDMP